MKTVMDTETAVIEVMTWCENFMLDMEEDIVRDSHMVKALRRGLISFDEESEVFTYRLIKPIELENGNTIETMKVEEPTAKHKFQKKKMRVKASGGKGEGEIDMDSDGAFLSEATGQPIGILQRLRSRDYRTLDELSVFFM